MSVLTHVDVVGVQRYVFASRRLADQVGASYLVELATGDLLRKVAADTGGAPVAVGGGNAYLTHADAEHAEAFSAVYSRRVHDDVPGLDAVCVHVDLDGDAVTAAALRAALEAAAIAKRSRTPGAALGGLAVTDRCDDSAEPASALGRRPHESGSVPLSAQVAAAMTASRQAVAQRDDLLDQWCQTMHLPLDLDLLSDTRGEMRRIAVVHVDGNGVGGRLQSWLAAREGMGDIRKELATLTTTLDQMALAAMRSVIDSVAACVTPSGPDGRPELSPSLGQAFRLHAGDRGRIELPIRPILTAGDDMVFVCDARIALPAACHALRSLIDGRWDPFGDGKGVPACAGIAIVRGGFPLARANELAVRSCRAAKAAVATRRSPSGCGLDWTIAGAGGDVLDQMSGAPFVMTERPYLLEDWEDVRSGILHTFLDTPWTEHRGQLRRLADAVRHGLAAVTDLQQRWARHAAELRLPPPVTDGFRQGYSTPLLDVLEIIDTYAELGPVANQAVAPSPPTTEASAATSATAEEPGVGA